MSGPHNSDRVSPHEERAHESSPNLGLISDLREVISWLEAHPELPAFKAYVMSGSLIGLERRQMLTVAEALDDPAERLEYDGVVVVRGKIGETLVTARTSVERLGGARVPEYKPVLSELGEAA